MRLEEILERVKAFKSKPGEEELRRLPYRKAFIYGRVSSANQVVESRESIGELARLLELAIQDGYRTGLRPDEVREWLRAIQDGTASARMMEDGEVAIDCRDLGLSGSLREDKRPGLARLWELVEAGEVGAVYLTEGMSRLSRDVERVLGYQLLALLKRQGCRVRTPEGVVNPAIPRDWATLADDVEDSAEEMKKRASG